MTDPVNPGKNGGNMRKLTAIILILTFPLIVSGCSFAGMSDDDLLQPPKATGIKAEIQNFLRYQSQNE